jgi:hypothetical protein
MLSTSPTGIPATVTGFPGRSAAACANCAVIVR